MILEDETFEVFGYKVWELKPHSHKLILVACDECGLVRKTSKNNYHPLCNSCAQKGKHLSEDHKAKISASLESNTCALGHTLTEEQKAKQSATMKGKTNALGSKRTEEQKAHLSTANKGENNPNYGKRGEDASNYKGGKKAAVGRYNAKRKRQLGFILLVPLKEGEEGHHVTDEYVIGIPAEVHKRFSGYSRRKHRALVLQWLKVNDKKKYKIVLCILAKEPLYMMYTEVIKE